MASDIVLNGFAPKGAQARTRGEGLLARFSVGIMRCRLAERSFIGYLIQQVLDMVEADIRYRCTRAFSENKGPVMETCRVIVTEG
jgi:hypothetical protein